MKSIVHGIAYLICFACMMLLISGCGVAYWDFPEIDGIEISGTPVDNQYNNTNYGAALVRIGDALYYNYTVNERLFGVVEISSEGAKPLEIDSPFSLAFYPTNYALKVVDDQLLIYTSYGTDPPNQYSFETESLVPFESVNGIALQSDRFHHSNDVLAQDIRTSKNSMELPEIHWYYQDSHGVLRENETIYDYYVTDTYIYYTVYVERDFMDYTELRRFDCKTQTDELILSPDKPSEMLIKPCGDYLLISTLDRETDFSLIQRLNLHGSLRDIETMYTFEDEIRWFNAYNQTLYFAGESTRNILETLNLNTGERKALWEDSKRIKSCYIVDDTWVYFEILNEKYNDELYRIKQDGTCYEKVYG